MILVAGSANLDFVVQAPHIPAPGETVLGSSYRNFPGGKGANQAVACARAGGAETLFVGAIGTDSLAQPIVASLRDAGVALQLIESESEPTGTAFICVASNGENAITVVPGANAALAPEHLPSLDGVSHLLVQLETPVATLQAFARSAKALGTEVVLNAAPANRECLPLLRNVDILVVNEGELAALSEVNGTIAEQMSALDVPLVVTTLGAQGCVAKTVQGYTLQPAFQVAAVDTTAAGDTFCGALVAALARGKGISGALRSASAAGALACTREGAQTSIPSMGEIEALLSTSNAPTHTELAALATLCGVHL